MSFKIEVSGIERLIYITLSSVVSILSSILVHPKINKTLYLFVKCKPKRKMYMHAATCSVSQLYS